ncbi:MAG: hypothetical protein HDR77_08715 [Bacteroides sp.]|nr:hypothetical protein [Bacteroides sp.]MBD5375539.1 hypothetical protein [Bacteroides sp.]
MRKKIMAAAAVAAVGISAYLGFGQKAEPTLTELQLANAEALTDIELDPVEVFCNTGGHGRCWKLILLIEEPPAVFRECDFSGSQMDFC